MRCTVPVPMPSDFATFKIPTPFASCFLGQKGDRSVAEALFAPRKPITGITICCLRACRQRPCHRRAAERRDELATFQLIELHSVPTSQGRIAGYRIGNGQSGGNGTILQPISRWRGWPMSEVVSGRKSSRRSRAHCRDPTLLQCCVQKIRQACAGQGNTLFRKT